MKKIKYLFLCLLFVVCSCNKQSDFDRAVAYQNDGEYEKAVKYYDFAIQKGENIAIAEKNLADIYFSKNNYNEAFNHYKSSLEIDADVVLDKVMQFISYSDENIRTLSYKTLSEIKNKESKNKIFAYLSNILRSEDQYKILDVLELLSKFNNFMPVAEDVLNLLDKDDLIIKQKVLPLLPDIPGMVVKKEYMNKVIDLLNQDNEILKDLAINNLGNMLGWAQKAIPPLVHIAVEQPEYKEKALHALEKIGVPTKEQVIEIFDYIKDKPVEIKVRLLEMLGNKRIKSKSFVPNFMTLLNDNSEDVKQSVRKSLSKIGKANPDCIPELINLLQDKNEEIQSRAIYELGDLGKESLQAVDSLKKISEDKNKTKDLRNLAKFALQKIQE